MSDVIVIAPDKFKGTLTAVEAARAMEECIKDLLPGSKVFVCPMADGGEGTSEILAKMTGCIGRRIECRNLIGVLKNVSIYSVTSECGGYGLSYIDCSDVVGLQTIGESERNPWHFSTYELGRIVKSELNHSKSLTVCLGGTATIDCGLGFLQALGAVITTSDGVTTEPVTPDMFREIVSVDVTCLKKDLFPGFGVSVEEEFGGWEKRFSDYHTLTFLSDVDVPLLSESGASMLTFAAQKGVDEEGHERLKGILIHLRDNVKWIGCNPDFSAKYGGAAGGLGFAMGQVLGLDGSMGAKRLLDMYDVFRLKPQLVITGEGRFDRQSSLGKVTGTIIDEAKNHGVECAIVAGCVADGCDSSSSGVMVVDSSKFFSDHMLDSTTARLRIREAIASIFVPGFDFNVVDRH